MEYETRNHVTGRDLPPELGTRQGLSLENELPDCGCEHSCPWGLKCAEGWGLANHPLAMVYAPCQGFHSLYDPDTALKRGTLFTELDLPLEVIGGGNGTVCGGCAKCANKRRR